MVHIVRLHAGLDHVWISVDGCCDLHVQTSILSLSHKCKAYQKQKQKKPKQPKSETTVIMRPHFSKYDLLLAGVFASVAAADTSAVDKSVKTRLAPRIKHHGHRGLENGGSTKRRPVSELQGYLDVLGKPNIRRTKATHDDRELAEKLGLGENQVSFGHQRNLNIMTFPEYCVATAGPYATGGYTCSCNDELQAVVCGQQQDEIYRYIVLMYDTASQSHGSGIDCICATQGCDTAGNVCIQVFTNVNGEPYCMVSDIAVDGSECSDCNMCPMTDAVYRVEVDQCLGVGIGSEPLGCLSTALVAPAGNDLQFDSWCSQKTSEYSPDGFTCECDTTDVNIICSRFANAEFQLMLLSYDGATQDTEAAIDCRCPDTSCEVSPSICHYVDSPESGAPSCLVFDLADPDLTECTQCRMCTSSNNGLFRMESDRCSSAIEPGCQESVLYGDFVAQGTEAPVLAPTQPLVANPTQPPATATQVPGLDTNVPAPAPVPGNGCPGGSLFGCSDRAPATASPASSACFVSSSMTTVGASAAAAATVAVLFV
jgi:hypothetical protein